MTSSLAVLSCEILKIRKSKVLLGTIAAFSIAPIMGALFVIVLRNPALTEANGALQAKAALTGFSPDWPSFFNLIAQAIGIGGLIIFGFAASWVFGSSGGAFFRKRPSSAVAFWYANVST